MMTRTVLVLSFLAALLSTSEAPASVMVNQAGYLPGAQKVFFSTSSADSFFVTESPSGVIVFSGKMSVSRANDPATGMTVYKGEFSSLKRSGLYVVLLSSSDMSSVFSIADTVFRSVYAKAVRGFYYQRCGQDLPAAYAGIYARAQCHTVDGFFHASTDTSGFMDVRGGWHDAGDYGKYIVNAGVTVGTLLMSYELFPTRFNSDVLGIPESGNGVPDLLDEARYELAWMLKMQHPGGGVYFKVTHPQFEGFLMPAADAGSRNIYQLSSTATGDFAAVMARASRVYRVFDKQFSDSCLAAARLAWGYLQSHASIVPTGGFKNPSGTATGEYGDGSDSDERLWAAAELFAATGESQFSSYYAFNYGTGALLSQTMGWANVRSMAHLAYLYTQQPSASSLIKSALRQSLVSYGATLVTAIGGEGFSVAIKPGQYYWGSNSEVLNRAILLILASREDNNTAMAAAALSQLNYILGMNAHNLSFVTGVGARHMMNPHHRPSASDGITEPVPGLLAGGPNQNRDDDALKAKFTASTPPALVYLDDVNSYASNEIAINWNAPLVFVAGYFASDGTVAGAPAAKDPLPTGYRMDQNYPNPFNPSTTISFALPAQSLVSVDVFDTAGRRVAAVVHAELPAGYHTAAFDARALSSGVYLYRLTAKNGGSVFTDTKRLVVIK
jgi:endoglucanase